MDIHNLPKNTQIADGGAQAQSRAPCSDQAIASLVQLGTTCSFLPLSNKKAINQNYREEPERWTGSVKYSLTIQAQFPAPSGVGDTEVLVLTDEH